MISTVTGQNDPWAQMAALRAAGAARADQSGGYQSATASTTTSTDGTDDATSSVGSSASSALSSGTFFSLIQAMMGSGVAGAGLPVASGAPSAQMAPPPDQGGGSDGIGDQLETDLSTLFTDLGKSTSTANSGGSSATSTANATGSADASTSGVSDALQKDLQAIGADLAGAGNDTGMMASNSSSEASGSPPDGEMRPHGHHHHGAPPDTAVSSITNATTDTNATTGTNGTTSESAGMTPSNSGDILMQAIAQAVAAYTQTGSGQSSSSSSSQATLLA